MEIKQDYIFYKNNDKYKIIAVVNDNIIYCRFTRDNKWQEFFILSKQEFLQKFNFV